MNSIPTTTKYLESKKNEGQKKTMTAEKIQTSRVDRKACKRPKLLLLGIMSWLRCLIEQIKGQVLKDSKHGFK